MDGLSPPLATMLPEHDEQPMLPSPPRPSLVSISALTEDGHNFSKGEDHHDHLVVPSPDTPRKLDPHLEDVEHTLLLSQPAGPPKHVSRVFYMCVVLFVTAALFFAFGDNLWPWDRRGVHEQQLRTFEDTYLVLPPNMAPDPTNLIVRRVNTLQRCLLHLGVKPEHYETVRDLDFLRDDLEQAPNMSVRQSPNAKTRPRYHGPLVIQSRSHARHSVPLAREKEKESTMSLGASEHFEDAFDKLDADSVLYEDS